MGTAAGIVRHEGLLKLWRGVSPAILRHVIYSGARQREGCSGPCAASSWLPRPALLSSAAARAPLNRSLPTAGLRMSIYENVRDGLFDVQPDGILSPSKALAGESAQGQRGRERVGGRKGSAPALRPRSTANAPPSRPALQPA